MTTPSPEASTDISFAFIETLVLIHRNFYRNLATPIPLNQFATLMTLRLEKQATISEIGQRLKICDKLMQAGLVTKQQDREDRRRILVSMTSAGEKMLDDQNEIVRQKFLSSLQEFSEEERAELYHSITDLNHYIEKMGPSHNG